MHDLVSEEQPANFEHASIAPLKIDPNLVCDFAANIPLHVEEAMNKLGLKTLTIYRKRVDNQLLTGLESLVERIVESGMNLLETVGQF